MACLVWAELGNMPFDDVRYFGAYDHKKSGNIRIGHHAGFCNCDWHHQAYPMDGWTAPMMRRHYGPSLAEGAKPFYATFGTQQELIAKQTAWLEANV